MRLIQLLSVVACVACGDSDLTRVAFEVDVLAELCDAAAACEGFEPNDCYDLLRSDDRTDCTYDAEQAAACADAIPVARCVDESEIGLPVWRVPRACDTVYDCGPITLEYP
jgi:hypothetical protein